MRRASLNHAYRLVWSHIFNAFVPVPEWAGTKGKRSGGGLAAAVLVAGAALAPAAMAENWSAGDGDWFDPANWDPTTVPTAADTVSVYTGATVQILSGDSAVADTLAVGLSSAIAVEGSLDVGSDLSVIDGSIEVQTGGVLNAGSTLLGNGPTQPATVVVEGTMNVSDFQLLRGQLSIQNGGLLTGTGDIVGNSGPSVLLVTGAGSEWDASAGTVDLDWDADITVADGGRITAPGFFLTRAASSFHMDGGTLRLSANNSRIFNNSFGLPPQITLGAGGGTIDSQAFTIANEHVISGTGELTKIGTGTLTLTGANSYSGGTTVTAGTLAGTTTSLQGDIDNNAAVVFNQTATGTYAGEMSGTGTLTKQGTGNVTLSGANSYSGGTTVSAGTLTGTTTSLQGAITNNAAVVLNQGTDGTYAGAMSGTGSLTKQGTGNVTLSGANTYSGGTTVSGGTLTGTTASLQGAITNNAAVVLNQGTDGTYAGAMSGTGSLTKQGTGNVTLSGANSYSGGTTVSAGTLTGTTTSLQGAITNNAAVVLNQGTDGTYAGAMSGNGSLTKQGTGNVTLSGANTYSGGTTVSAGTLTGTTTSLQGAITNNAAVVLNQGTDGTYAGEMSGTGTLTKQGTGNVTLSGANTYSGGTTVSAGTLTGTTTSLQGSITNNAAVVFNQATDGTYAGAMSGTGSLTKSGAGSVTLSGMNTYTGTTAVDAGRLVVNGSHAIADTSAVTVATGAQFEMAQTETIGSLAGAGQVLLNPGALTIGDNNTSTTYSGAMSGNGSLIKSGTGTLTLSGTNTFTGITNINAGTLRLEGGSAIGDTRTIAVHTGATLALGASETIGALEGAGSVNLGGNTLTAGGGNGSTTFSGVASGTGGLVKTGTGNLTLSGANTYSGGTTVSAGTLTGTTTSLQGAITNNAAVVFNQASDGTYAGAVSGSGSVTKSGSGNLTLSGANSYSGGTTVSAGTLTGTTASLQGAITNNAAVAFNQAADGSYAGVMSGTGSLTKSGSGMLTLAGANTVSGATTVAAGTLRVNGALDDSIVTVHDGARLEGTGSIGGLVVVDGATLAPGNSIGTFAVTSDVTFEAGSLFEVEVDADGNGDRLDVTGSVTIDGGTVSVLADETGSWAYTTDYTLLSADGGISGTFDDVVTDLAFLDPTLTYDAGTVLLKLTRNDVEFGGIGRDRNEIAAGDALTAILQAGASPDMAGLIGTMTGLSTASAQRSLQTLAGSSVPNVASIIGTGWRTVQARSADLRAQSGYSGPSAGDATTTLRQWGDVFGSRMTVDSAATVTGFESRLSAAILGVDGMLDGRVQLGASLAYVLDNSEFDLLADEFDTRSVYFTGHAAGDAGDRMTWSVQLGAGAGTVETQRTVIVGATTYLPEGETDTLDLRAYGELAFPLRKDSLGVAPVLGLGAGRTTLDAYTETGGGPVNLSVAEETFDSLSSHAGLRLRLPSDNSSMVVEATATWTHEFGDVTPATTMQFASDPVAAFTVYGAELARDSVQARVRVSGELGAGISGYIEGNGDWREDARALGAALGFSVDW